MNTRRTFLTRALSLLAALPVVGRFAKASPQKICLVSQPCETRTLAEPIAFRGTVHSVVVWDRVPTDAEIAILRDRPPMIF